MTLLEIEQAVYNYLVDNWLLTPILPGNIKTVMVAPYIEFLCTPGQINALEIQGAGERVGIFVINIYTAIGIGVQEGNSYGSSLESLFWHKTISGVTCESGTVLPYTKFLGENEEKSVCHHQTIIPFSVITESL